MIAKTERYIKQHPFLCMVLTIAQAWFLIVVLAVTEGNDNE